MNMMDSEKVAKLKAFAKVYNAFKQLGFRPVDICQIISTLMGIGSSSYYRLLKSCRDMGYIEDTYEENKAKMIERLQTSKVDESVAKLILSNVGQYKLTKDGDRTVCQQH